MGKVKKIVILGGESTGKSTLCAQLALHYHTTWVKEYARTYLESLNRAYIETDLLVIAKGQLDAERKNMELANHFIFCDTDLNVLKVWSEYKYGRCDTDILKQIVHQKCDAYILTAPDFPWEDDPLREHPEPALREHFFQVYLEIIQQTKLPYCIVKGSESKRLKNAIKFIDQL